MATNVAKKIAMAVLHN